MQYIEQLILNAQTREWLYIIIVSILIVFVKMFQGANFKTGHNLKFIITILQLFAQKLPVCKRWTAPWLHRPKRVITWKSKWKYTSIMKVFPPQFMKNHKNSVAPAVSSFLSENVNCIEFLTKCHNQTSSGTTTNCFLKCVFPLVFPELLKKKYIKKIEKWNYLWSRFDDVDTFLDLTPPPPPLWI